MASGEGSAGEGLILGLDIGGTKVHAVAFDDDLEPLIDVRVATAATGPEAIGHQVVSVINELVGKLDGHHLDAVGIGIPGLVDRDRGAVTQAVNLAIGEQPLDLAELVRSEFDVTCAVGNDVNVAALGALRLLRGAGSGDAAGSPEPEPITDLAYLSIGTGIAAGIVLDGALHRGHRGVAGEIGHIPVAPDGPVCRCGLRGCLEVVASGSAIATRWPANGTASPTESLVASARSGDASARVVLDEVAGHLATAVYLLAVTYDIDRVVIGGGVAELDQVLLEIIRDGLATLGERSGFVRSLDLGRRLMLKPDGPVAAIGAAELARSAGQGRP